MSVETTVQRWRKVVIEKVGRKIASDPSITLNPVQGYLTNHFTRICQEITPQNTQTQGSRKSFILFSAFCVALGIASYFAFKTPFTNFIATVITWQAGLCLLSWLFSRYIIKMAPNAVVPLLQRHLLVSHILGSLAFHTALRFVGFWATNICLSHLEGSSNAFPFYIALLYGLATALWYATRQYLHGKTYYVQIKAIVLKRIV